MTKARMLQIQGIRAYRIRSVNRTCSVCSVLGSYPRRPEDREGRSDPEGSRQFLGYGPNPDIPALPPLSRQQLVVVDNVRLHG